MAAITGFVVMRFAGGAEIFMSNQIWDKKNLNDLKN